MPAEGKPNFGIFLRPEKTEQNASVEEVRVEDITDSSKVRIKVRACRVSLPPVEFAKLLSIEKVAVGLDVVGTVVECGKDVTRIQPGQQCLGIIPLDSGESGCSELVTMEESEVVCKSGDVSSVELVSVLSSGVEAIMALHYLGHVRSGDCVIVMSGATSAGLTTIQIAHHWGCRVLTTYSREDEKTVLNTIKTKIAGMIDVSIRGNILVKQVMEHTGGEGVQLIIDSGISQFDADDKPDNIDGPPSTSSPHHHQLPHIQEILNCLGACSRWVTRQPDLQLDPPHTRLLWLRSASLCMLQPHTWLLAGNERGRYLHVLTQVMDYLNEGIITPHIHHTITHPGDWEELRSSVEVELKQHQLAGSVVLELK